MGWSCTDTWHLQPRRGELDLLQLEMRNFRKVANYIDDGSIAKYGRTVNIKGNFLKEKKRGDFLSWSLHFVRGLLDLVGLPMNLPLGRKNISGFGQKNVLVEIEGDSENETADDIFNVPL